MEDNKILNLILDKVTNIEKNYQKLDVKISNIEKRQEKFEQEFMDFKKEMTDFKTEMTDFKTEMTDFKTEMTDFKTEMTDMKKTVDFISASQKTLMYYVVNIDRAFNEQSKRIEKLEQKIS